MIVAAQDGHTRFDIGEVAVHLDVSNDVVVAVDEHRNARAREHVQPLDNDIVMEHQRGDGPRGGGPVDARAVAIAVRTQGNIAQLDAVRFLHTAPFEVNDAARRNLRVGIEGSPRRIGDRTRVVVIPRRRDEIALLERRIGFA